MPIGVDPHGFEQRDRCGQDRRQQRAHREWCGLEEFLAKLLKNAGATPVIEAARLDFTQRRKARWLIRIMW